MAWRRRVGRDMGGLFLLTYAIFMGWIALIKMAG